MALILAIALLLLATERYAETLAIPTCPTSCGDLTIPFPFGTSSDCSLDDSFLVSCNHSYNPPRPFLNLGSLVVLDISSDGLMKVASSVASVCYDGSGSQANRTFSGFTSSKFLISSRLNKFTAIGCDMYAGFQGSTDWNQMSASCVSRCDKIDRVANRTCSGIGCCQTSIPEGVRHFSIEIHRNHSLVNSFRPCGYAFVVETASFNFSSSDLMDFQSRKTVPVVLDWSVDYLTCAEAQRNSSNFACYANSDCIDSSSGVGYLCKCTTGFQGNPYNSDGCSDINECIDLEPCEGSCTNLPGSYLCSCPVGYEGDGKKEGEGCRSKTKYNGSLFFYIASGLMVPVIGSSWIFSRRKQNKVDRLRWNLFLKNGGQFLEGKFQIFRAEDMKKATNNYDEDNVVSGFEEHYRVMYRAVLPDGVIATIVKHDAVEECNMEVFITNLITLSKLRHRNIVKLLGCCLETQVPLLVFELFEHESLYDHLHHDIHHARGLSWDFRLKIATETARVLEYMHSAFEVQVIHGRLSSSSIVVLDGCYTMKLHDISSNFKTYSDTSSVELKCNAMRYLDPQYFFTNELTTKSDVYSFGIILAEILTGQKVISSDRPRGEESLVQYFVNRSDNLDHMVLDRCLESDGRIDELTQVAALAKRCLSFSPADRPTMAEVADTLTIISGVNIVYPNVDREITICRVEGMSVWSRFLYLGRRSQLRNVG